MASASFERFATETISIKRAPAFVGGVRGDAATVTGLSSIKATYPTPVDAQTRARVAPDTAHLILDLFVEGDYDIRDGDLVTWNGVDYPIRQCEPWHWQSTTWFRLYIEQLT